MVETGLLVTGLVLSYLASLLLKPKTPQNPAVRNATAPTYAERGSYIPYVLGTQRIGAVVGWIGKPKVTSKTKGGFLGFGAVTTKTTAQQGWHILCIGPAAKLNKIFENGKIIFPYAGEVPLSPAGHASGSTIKLKSKRGTFRIYWGESNQPVDAVLKSTNVKNPGTGTQSRWPGVCHIVWDTKALEVANQWPQIDYEIEVHPTDSTAILGSGEAAFLEGVTDPLQGSPFLKNTGCNVAHAIVQIMCGPYPRGVGIDQGDINLCQLQALATLVNAAHENQPCNIYVPDGQNALNPITAILSDTSAIMSQTGNKISVIPVRASDDSTLPVLDNGVLLPPLAQKEFLFGPQPISQVTYLYKDREIAYRDNDITISNDSISNGVVNGTQVRLDSIIDRDIAITVTDRKQQEDLTAVRSFTVTASRGARLLSPGQAFITADLGRLRVSAISRLITSASVEIDCALDVFSPPPTGIVPDEPIPSTPGTPADTIPHDLFDFIELPPLLADNTLCIAVLRQRQDTNVDSADIEASIDNVNYIDLGTIFGVFLLGTLNVAMTVDSPAALSLSGPVITVTDEDDNDLFTDLSLQALRWRSGEQVMVIDNEIFYFENLAALGSGQYEVHGIIRGRSGSLPKAHAASTNVWLAPMASLNALAGSVLIPGQTLYIKDLAIIGDDSDDDTTVTPISHAFVGVSKSPYPPCNFAAQDLGMPRDTWLTGGPVNLKWSNRVRNVGSVAGTMPAGVAHVAPAMDGALIVIVKDTGGVVKMNLTMSSGTTYTILNAALVSAFGSEPSAFDITYYQFDGAFGSELNTVRINRR